MFDTTEDTDFLSAALHNLPLSNTLEFALRKYQLIAIKFLEKFWFEALLPGLFKKKWKTKGLFGIINVRLRWINTSTLVFVRVGIS